MISIATTSWPAEATAIATCLLAFFGALPYVTKWWKRHAGSREAVRAIPRPAWLAIGVVLMATSSAVLFLLQQDAPQPQLPPITLARQLDAEAFAAQRIDEPESKHEYETHIGAVCALADHQESRWSAVVARFNGALSHAQTVDAERDAIFEEANVAQRNIGELWSRVGILAPPSDLLVFHIALLATWHANLTVLHTYLEHLEPKIRSLEELEKIAETLPRSVIAESGLEARRLLLRLGSGRCHLSLALTVPVAHWSHWLLVTTESELQSSDIGSPATHQQMRPRFTHRRRHRQASPLSRCTPSPESKCITVKEAPPIPGMPNEGTDNNQASGQSPVNVESPNPTPSTRGAPPIPGTPDGSIGTGSTNSGVSNSNSVEIGNASVITPSQGESTVQGGHSIPETCRGSTTSNGESSSDLPLDTRCNGDAEAKRKSTLQRLTVAVG
jgi:hypothetical protein